MIVTAQKLSLGSYKVYIEKHSIDISDVVVHASRERRKTFHNFHDENFLIAFLLIVSVCVCSFHFIIIKSLLVTRVVCDMCRWW